MTLPIDLYDSPAFTLVPQHLTDVPYWKRHIPFAFLAIELLRPRILVELGTHKGDSYMAFCQAVAALGTGTRCYAVDHWIGEETSGLHPAGLYDWLKRLHDPLYGDFSLLMQTSFDDAMPSFADGSIDLLHIDGMHTYDAVRHDFETWAPKLSDRAVVLMHDVNEFQSNFGVWKYWRELQPHYPTFLFPYGHGLGVVGVGRDIPEAFRRLFELGDEDRQRFFQVMHAASNRIVLKTAQDDLTALREQYGIAIGERDQARQGWSDTAETARTLSQRVDDLGRELQASHDLLAREQQAARDAQQAAQETFRRVSEAARLERETQVRNMVAEQVRAEEERTMRFADMLRTFRESAHRLAFLAELVPDPSPELQSLRLRCLELTSHPINPDIEEVEGLMGYTLHSLHQLESDYRALFARMGIDATGPQNADLYGRTAVRAGMKLLRLWMAIWRVAGPPGSRRRRALSLPLRAVRALRLHGLRGTAALALARLRRRDDAVLPPGVTLRPADQAVGEPAAYGDWIRNGAGALLAGKLDERADDPTISVILPVYKVKSDVLALAIDSVVRQTYPKWQICLAVAEDEGSENCRLAEEYARKDSRITYRRLAENKGISGNSNAALEDVTGEFVALLDHDDELAPEAFATLIAEARRRPEVDFWYTDKDSVTAAGEKRVNLLLKPDWSPEMMFSVNYLTHLDLIRTRVLREIGGWNGETDGAQDWDLFLRVAEHGAVVARAAGVLYHWRIIAGSTSTGVAAKPYVPKAQLRTLQGYVDRLGLPARLEPNPVTGFRLRWPNATGTGLLLLLADPAMFDATAVTRAILLARRLCLGRDMRLIVCATATEVGLYAEADGDVQIVTGTDLAEAVTRAVTEHAAATVTLLSSGVTAAAGDLLAEHTGWLAHHREIAFVTSLVFDRGGKVMEAGCAVDARPVAHPMFRGDERTTFGWFGSPSWYRNCRAASPIAVTFRRDDLAAALTALPPGSADIGAMTTAACLAAVADGRRGLVNPHSWVRYGLDVPEMPEFDQSVGQDPFFHPAFAGVSPLVLKTN